MGDDRAYAGTADNTAGASEWNRTSFAVEQILNKRATMTLVQVKAVEGDRLSVQPIVTQLDGAGNALPHGQIHDVPFVTLQAGGSAVILVPVVGDIGLAIFAQSDISRVKSTKAEAPPGSFRRSDWADAVYVGGLLNAEPDQYVRLDADGVAIQSLSGKRVAIASDVALEVTGPVTTDTEYQVNGMRVVTDQQGAITDPTGGSTIDTQARTAIAAILTALRAHGLVAT